MKKVILVAIIIGLLVGMVLAVAYANCPDCPYCGLLGFPIGKQKADNVSGYICFYRCSNNHTWACQCWGNH